jgi:uncharacterized protein (DUF433 family)
MKGVASLRIVELMPKRMKKQHPHDTWSPEFLQLLGSCTEPIERPTQQPITMMRDPFGDDLNFPSMSDDAAALLNDVLLLPENERLELASRLFAQESSVISAEPDVMSGAPVFKGTRVLAQTLIEYLEAGDSIDDFLEGFPSVSREQVIAFLEETKARVLAYAG